MKASARIVPGDIKLTSTISARKDVVVMDNATFRQYIVTLVGYNLTAIGQ